MNRQLRVLFALPVTLGLVLAPTTALAADPTPDPLPTALVSPSPTPTPEPSASPEPTADQPTLEPGGEPLDDTAPADPKAEPPTERQQRQTQADMIAKDAKQKAQAAAEQAVAEARAKWAQALAKHRIAKYEVLQLQQRSQDAARDAARLRRDIGNLARMAYTTGDADLAMIELLLESDPDSDTDVLSGIQAAQRATTHKDVQLAHELRLRAQADELARQAEQLAQESAKTLAEARAGLKKAISLAESVNLAIAPIEDPPPVDLTTKSDWIFPVASGQIDSEAGMRMHPILGYSRCHAGADITAAAGTQIFAVDDGVVLTAGENGGYGNYTLIAHGGGMSSAYAHQSELLVKPGDRVTRGQLIGLVGTTGLSTGPHLHFEARYQGVPYNPRGWLEERPDLRVPAC